MGREFLTSFRQNRFIKAVFPDTFSDVVIISILIGVLVGLVTLLTSSANVLTGNSSPKNHSQGLSETAGVNHPTSTESVQLRDFTVDQLREFDGENDKPIYVALRGEVFDVTIAKDMYGPGSGYHCFAGREASRAMGKLSFDEAELSSLKLDDLSPFERDTLNDWVDKFKYYKAYPVVGRVSVPPEPRDFTVEELKNFKGDQEIPDGRVHAPIYLGISGKVLDVSYGGYEMYGPNGGYHIFGGIDASRCLARMSFAKEDRENRDLSDLLPEQLKALEDWERRLSAKYPVVGRLP